MMVNHKECLARFGLALHEDMTRLIAFGRLPPFERRQCRERRPDNSFKVRNVWFSCLKRWSERAAQRVGLRKGAFPLRVRGSLSHGRSCEPSTVYVSGRAGARNARARSVRAKPNGYSTANPLTFALGPLILRCSNLGKSLRLKSTVPVKRDPFLLMFAKTLVRARTVRRNGIRFKRRATMQWSGTRPHLATKRRQLACSLRDSAKGGCVVVSLVELSDARHGELLNSLIQSD